MRAVMGSEEVVSDEKQEPLLLRPIDAAVRMNVSIGTVYILIRTGELASQMAMVPGRQKAQRMIPVESVEAWKAAR